MTNLEIILSAVGTVTTGGVTVCLAMIRSVSRAATGHRRAQEKATADCEARYATLSGEIRDVRDASWAQLLKASREQTEAMAEATAAKRENTRVLDRVCRRLETLPCARDAAERVPLQDPTPQAHDALPERSHP